MDFLVPIISLGIPGLTWLISYALLAREFGTWNLLHVKIHESGKYSLLGTVFYFDHFLRELPINSLYALAILWSYSAAGIQTSKILPAAFPFFYVICLVIFLGFVFAGSLHKVGLRSTLQDVLQFHETDERIGWGTHWQMHFLSTAALLLALILPGTLFREAARTYPSLMILFGTFFVLSIIFRSGTKAIRHTRWILHGGRELFTYLFIVVIPSVSPLITHATTGKIWLGPYSLLALGLLLTITLYHFFVYWQNDLTEHAPSSRGLIYLLSSHFFEHVLDFFYILLFVMAMSALGRL